MGGWWGLTLFLMTNNDLLKAVHLVNKKRNFVFLCFFWVSQNEKKTFPFCFKKITTSFFTCLFFFGFAQNEKNKFPFYLALLKDEKKATATFFICLFFFLLPSMMTIDDKWVGGMEFWNIPLGAIYILRGPGTFLKPVKLVMTRYVWFWKICSNQISSKSFQIL